MIAEGDASTCANPMCERNNVMSEITFEDLGDVLCVFIQRTAKNKAKNMTNISAEEKLYIMGETLFSWNCGSCWTEFIGRPLYWLFSGMFISFFSKFSFIATHKSIIT
eukprot:TRINITY_DN3965_c0_g1_i3.p1 TRINITY_DN3965_c0_g1~~TRINITY_DN3965_c0_g1_i3.p1  ORF type:complete len:108 (+),score=13.91 TRINITY_DN3965_c0_g1_i3:88-411(+)